MAYKPKSRWTAVQENFLRENWTNMTDEQIADQLGRTPKSVRRKRQSMKYKKANGRGVCAAFEEKGNTNVN